MLDIAYIQGQNTIQVTSTKNLAVGLFVSSGRSYPDGTKIVSIDSETQVTINNAALANSGGGGGAPAGTTCVSGTGGGQLLLELIQVLLHPRNTFNAVPLA